MQRSVYAYLMGGAAALVMTLASTALAADSTAPGPSAGDVVVDDAVKPISLRPRFVAGRKSRYEVWTSRQTHATVTAAGRAQQHNSSMEIAGEVQWEVERVGNDGSAMCIMTMDWLTASVVLDDGSTVECDSRRPAKAGGAGTDTASAEVMIGQFLKAVTAVPLKVKMNADGTVMGVTGVEQVRRKAVGANNLPDELDFMETASDLATIVAAPPASAVGGPGAKWNTTLVWNHELGKLQEQMTYLLNGTEEIAGIPVATVFGSAKIKFVLDPSKLQPRAGSAKADVRLTNGSFDTQIMFDLSRGEAIGRNTLQRVGIEIRAKAENATIVSDIDETIQSQALRIWED